MTLSQFSRMVKESNDLELAFAESNLEAALKALMGTPPDVLVTDLNLPDGSGIDLISFCKEKTP